tara:strand:- start:38542 stop:38982 length:441 start_codon:yes stop_codon:yes gene_type:complete
MSLRFQRLIIIFITLIFLFGAVILILFNTKQNIVFFYTPTELLDIKIKYNSKIRIGGFVKKNSLEKIDKNKYKFEITDNKNNLTIIYEGILPDLFREGQGAVIEGYTNKSDNIVASRVFAKHDENYMPASIKKELEKNNQWKKNYK